MNHHLAFCRAFSLCICVSLLNAARAEEPNASEVGPEAIEGIKKLLSDEGALKDFAACTKVEAYLLQRRTTFGAEAKKEEPAKQEIGYSKVMSGPIELKQKTVAQFKTLLLNPASYRKRMVECEPEPGVAIRFSCKGSQWDVLICLDCDLLELYHNDKYLGLAEFEPTHDQFTTLVKGLYPDDAFIQKIK